MSLSTRKKVRVKDMSRGATSADAFLGGRLDIIQPRRGHRAGSDAVFLAAAVSASSKGRVLDAGAGVGVAGLCLLARVPGLTVTAVEIDQELCALAAHNAERNGFSARFEAVNADATSAAGTLRAAGLEPESFDQVIANPPFHAEGSVRSAPHRGRAAAHIMAKGELSTWLRFLTHMAAPKAELTLIHRPENLRELLGLLDGRFGGVTIFPLFARAAEPAIRIILQGRKGSRAGPRLLPGLVLHCPDGRYTAEAEAVLRHGAALSL